MRFVAQRDTSKRFRFTPIQSDYGARLARAFGIDPDDPDTNAVIHGGEVFMKSDAALTVLSQLPGWGWVRALFAVPKALRDPVYSLIARNRYRIFGKYDACFVPDADLFKGIASGKASVVTDEIECFVENGIQLKSGKLLEADVIVTATGLNLLALGAVRRAA